MNQSTTSRGKKTELLRHSEIVAAGGMIGDFPSRTFYQSPRFIDSRFRVTTSRFRSVCDVWAKRTIDRVTPVATQLMSCLHEILLAVRRARPALVRILAGVHGLLAAPLSTVRVAIAFARVGLDLRRIARRRRGHVPCALDHDGVNEMLVEVVHELGDASVERP